MRHGMFANSYHKLNFQEVQAATGPALQCKISSQKLYRSFTLSCTCSFFPEWLPMHCNASFCGKHRRPNMLPTGKHEQRETHKSCRDEAGTQANQADVFLLQWFCGRAHKMSQASLCRTVNLHSPCPRLSSFSPKPEYRRL